jgi:hypothetical protein
VNVATAASINKNFGYADFSDIQRIAGFGDITRQYAKPFGATTSPSVGTASWIYASGSRQ